MILVPSNPCPGSIRRLGAGRPTIYSGKIAISAQDPVEKPIEAVVAGLDSTKSGL